MAAIALPSLVFGDETKQCAGLFRAIVELSQQLWPVECPPVALVHPFRCVPAGGVVLMHQLQSQLALERTGLGVGILLPKGCMQVLFAVLFWCVSLLENEWNSFSARVV